MTDTERAVQTAYSEDDINPLAAEVGQDWANPQAPIGEVPGETFTDEHGKHRHVRPREDGRAVPVGIKHTEES